MRKIFALLIALFLVSAVNTTTSFAQDYSRWSLPDGAIARLGKGTVDKIAYSEDGSFAVAGGAGIWLYDATGAETALLTGHTYAYSVAFSPDGTQLASGEADAVVRLWDVAARTLLHTFKGERGGEISSVAFSPDGTTIASGGRNENVYLWDVATRSRKAKLNHDGDSEWVLGVAFSRDGRTLATGTDYIPNAVIRLWDTSTLKLIKATNLPESNHVGGIAYNPDSTIIASGSYGGKVYLWDAANLNLLNTLTGHIGGYYVHSVAFSRDGRTLASGDSKNMVLVWDAVSDTLRNTLVGHTDRVITVAYSPDGTLASGGWDGIVQLWDVATETPRKTIKHTSSIHNVAYSPNGTTLATGHSGMLHLWDVARDTRLNTLRYALTVDDVQSVAYHPDSTILASGSRENAVQLWNVDTGAPGKKLEQSSRALSVAFSPDRTTLASSDGGVVRLWDVDTGVRKDTLRIRDVEGVIESMAYSPDGSTLAVAAYKGVHLWDMATNTLRKTVEHTNWIKSIAYSPDGKTIAAGSRDGSILIWDAVSGRLKIRIHAHHREITSIAYSHDSKTIASGAHDNLVHLSDVATGDLTNTLRHSHFVEGVAFSRDGTTLATASQDGTVLLWGLTPTTPPLTFGSSTIADQTFEVGTPVNLTLPSATGGTAPYTYTLTPIPAGLQFDSATQVLSGTPTTVTPATPVTYTVTDAAGTTASLTFTITVMDAPPAGITFIPNAIDDLTLTVNTPMDPLSLPRAEGGTSPYTYTLDPLPVGLSFDAATQLLSGTPTTVGTMPAVYIATDATGASAALNFIIEVIEDDPGDDALDVNGDGQVSVIDLAMVALFYGTQVPAGFNLPADVNTDGVVNLADLTAVAVAIDAAGGGANQVSLQDVKLALLIAAEQAVELEAAAGAPGRAVASVRLSAQNVSNALAAARTDVRFQKSFAVLEAFLALLTELTAIPETTALLANYPNPFNPETWIPYHLATDADVKMTIYNVRGGVVRELVLGHQAAGVYESRGRAAYWDGKNQIGEKVASGVYFYTLTAGDFTATRKLLIAK